MKKVLLTGILAVIVIFLNAQCTIQTIAKLPGELDETSALVHFDGYLWTINDSGNSNTVYAIDTLGEIAKTIEIDGAKNVDWEALAIDSENLYIGDFGNNFNMRTDLVIYVVKRSELNGKSAKPHMQIRFEYPDQVSWQKSVRKTPFDCEAMIVVDDKIWLFTKDWKSYNGALYQLNKKLEKQTAERMGDLNAMGLVTDATQNGNRIYLIGYQNYVPILWEYLIDDMSKYLNRYEFTNFKKYQTEGITILNDEVFITCEKSESKQSLFTISCP